jgi:hypothetical protein
MTRPTRPTRPLVAVVLAATLVAAGAACTVRTPVPGTPGAFTAVPPPAPGGRPAPIDLHELACASPTSCVALPLVDHVGQWGEAWDGRSWRPIPSVPAGELDCAGNRCLGVAILGGAAWSWNGTAWAERVGPGFAPLDIDCWAADACAAVGYDVATNGTAVARWDGAAWTPTPVPPVSTTLQEIECRSANDCAVLGYRGPDYTRALERWDGTGWSVSPTAGGYYDHLSCTPTTCLLRGWATPARDSGMVLLGEQGDGSFAPLDLPDPGEVRAVDCAVDGCVVLTPSATATGTPGAWTTGPARSYPEAPPLVCPATSFCAALPPGFDAPDAARPPTVDHWDGTAWTTVAATGPNPLVTDAALVGVSCVVGRDGDECVAVGRYADGAVARPYAVRWRAGRWRQLPAPPAPAGGALIVLEAVSCATAATCVVAGHARTRTAPAVSRPYVARLTGDRWVDESAAIDAPPGTFQLSDVSCRPVACTAVGSAVLDTGEAPGGASAAFVSTAAGAWTTVPGPPGSVSPVSEPGTGLRLDCASRTSCAAVSTLFGGFGPLSVLSYWDGAVWSTPHRRDALMATSVTCPAPGRCLVAGALGYELGLVLAWNGTTWVEEPAPDTVGSPVSCATPDRCLVLGWSRQGSSALATSAVRDGTGWRPVGGSPPHHEWALADVSCTPTLCLAVGPNAGRPAAYLWRF